MKRSQTSSKIALSKKAFTLVEMLVIVAIIGILAALLLPALAKGTSRGKRMQCLSNQRQLALTWVMYQSDNNERLVSNGLVDAGGNPNRKTWVQGRFANGPDNTNSALLIDPKYALFAPYLQKAKVYNCPSDIEKVAYAGNLYPKLRSYALNAYAGWEDTFGPSFDNWDSRLGVWDSRLHRPRDYILLKKYGDMVGRSPAEIFIFQDVYPKSICWPYFGVAMFNYIINTDTFFNFPNNQHERAGVISFADGHAERHPWKDQRTMVAYAGDYHAHSQISAYNADIQWLKVHTTIPR